MTPRPSVAPHAPAGWLSWFGNSIVLFILFRQKATLQPTDYLTFNLAVSDASISVFGYSRGIIEIFNVFQDSGYLISSIWTCQVKSLLTCPHMSSRLSYLSPPPRITLVC